MKFMTYLRICISDFGMRWKDDFFCNMIMMNEMCFYFVYLNSFLVLLFAVCLMFAITSVCTLLALINFSSHFNVFQNWISALIQFVCNAAALINFIILKTDLSHWFSSLIQCVCNAYCTNQLQYTQCVLMNWFSALIQCVCNTALLINFSILKNWFKTDLKHWFWALIQCVCNACRTNQL